MMKRKYFALFLMFITLFALFTANGLFLSQKTARAAQPQYARIMTETAVLYRTQSGDDAVTNKYFVLPKGYFVYLDDTGSDTWYKVTYDIFTGFVRADDVDIVSFEPKVKYAVGQTIRIETPDGGNCNLREYAVKTSGKMLEGGIPDETRGIQFYNYMNSGNEKWYFISYMDKSGYVHGDYAFIETAIAVNDGAAVPTPEPKKENDAPPPLDITTLIILIGAVSLPAVIILVLLFKPRRRPPRPRLTDFEDRRVPKYYDGEERRLPPPQY